MKNGALAYTRNKMMCMVYKNYNPFEDVRVKGLEANSPCHWCDEWFLDVHALGFLLHNCKSCNGISSQRRSCKKKLLFFSCKVGDKPLSVTNVMTICVHHPFGFASHRELQVVSSQRRLAGGNFCFFSRKVGGEFPLSLVR
ncbi:hypothetical protein BDB01DRAFT_837914 [Pilobolus umbonatus]|nr:hypothetical protein BDB01DRAFT_837914 [Pilobolus umbonatus]